MKKLNLTNIPDNWYEKNHIIACSPCSGIVVCASSSESGDYFGLVRYYMEINGQTVPISERLFNAFICEYEVYSYYEYIYLNKHCHTYRIYEHDSGFYLEN